MRSCLNLSVFFIAVLVLVTSCVSNQAGLSKSDTIYIETNPAGATILVNNEFAGISPLNVKTPTDKDFLNIQIMKNGYQTEEISFSPREEKIDIRKQNVLINSTLFFGGVGLLAGFASGNPLAGLGGGVVLGLTTGLLQEKKDSATKYDYPQEDIRINLSPLTGK